MKRYDIALFLLLVFFFITAKYTRNTLKPLRSGVTPKAKEIEAFGEAATFFVSSVYMMIWWLIFRHVNIWLLVIIEVVCHFTYPRWAWWFVKVDKEKDAQ